MPEQLASSASKTNLQKSSATEFGSDIEWNGIDSYTTRFRL